MTLLEENLYFWGLSQFSQWYCKVYLFPSLLIPTITLSRKRELEIVKAWWITESDFAALQGINGGPGTSRNLPNDTQWASRSAPVLSHMPPLLLELFYPIICCLLAICLHSSTMPGSVPRDAEFKYDVIPLRMRIAKGMFFHQVFLRGIVRSFIYNG